MATILDRLVSMDDASPFDYLSLYSCVSICLTFSIAYILALYLLSPSTHRYERNHSKVIYRRFLAVTIVCSLIYLFLKHSCNPNVDLNAWLGLRTDVSSVWTLLAHPTLLLFMLYLGPILQWLVLFDWEYYQAHLRYHCSSWNTNERLIFLRNYLVAPLTEEFVYRSSMLCVLYSHVSLYAAVFVSPLFFGLAHLHHMLEHFKQNSDDPRQRIPPMTIVLMHLFQFSYTYIFGVYSSFLFIRTGHFLPSLIVHSLCNGFGVPDLLSLFDRHDRHVKRRCFLILCYLVGVWLFSTNLYHLTEPKFYYANDDGSRGHAVLYRHWSTQL